MGFCCCIYLKVHFDWMRTTRTTLKVQFSALHCNVTDFINFAMCRTMDVKPSSQRNYFDVFSFHFSLNFSSFRKTIISFCNSFLCLFISAINSFRWTIISFLCFSNSADIWFRDSIRSFSNWVINFFTSRSAGKDSSCDIIFVIMNKNRSNNLRYVFAVTS